MNYLLLDKGRVGDFLTLFFQSAFLVKAHNKFVLIETVTEAPVLSFWAGWRPCQQWGQGGRAGGTFVMWKEMHRVKYEVEKRGQGTPVHAVKPVWGKTCVCVSIGTVGGWGHRRRPSWPQRPEVPVRTWRDRKQSLSLSRTFSSVPLVGWDRLRLLRPAARLSRAAGVTKFCWGAAGHPRRRLRGEAAPRPQSRGKLHAAVGALPFSLGHHRDRRGL